MTGKDDPDAHGENTSVKLVASGGGYAGISASVGVKVTDDDTYEPPIVDPESQKVDEGANGTLDVRLSTQPIGDVTVSVTSDNGAVTVEPASLTFTESNYASVQTVTVTAAEDDDAADENVTVTVAANGGGYTGESTEVKVTVEDPDDPALVVSRSSLGLDENGSRTFTVKLATQPTGDVAVTVKSGDIGAVSAKPASLGFDPDNWDRARTVTVSGKDDADASHESTSVSLVASGGDYEGESAEVKVTIEDDDTKGVVVSPTPPEFLSVDEGGSRPFSVKLATEPTGDVTVSVSVSPLAAGEMTVNPASLTFKQANYGTWQTVWVSGDQDDDASDEKGGVKLSASGSDYGGQEAWVYVAVDDDDEAALVVSRTSLAVNEGSSGTYTVKLATEPTAAVTVTISGMAKGVTVDDSSLAFSTSNWDTAQTVTVSAAEDDNAASEEVTLINTPSGGGYGSVAAKSVVVTTEDDDTPALVVSPMSLEVGEGNSATYTVELATQPSGPVTVTVSGMAKGVSVDDSSLTFSTSNWGDAQTVTVSAAEDDNAASEEVTLTNTPSGGGYGSVAAKSVVVTTEDDDTPALVVSPASLEVAEGSSDTYTVKLATQPSSAVTVTISGMAKGVSVDDSSLTFSTSNWSNAQAVTVSAAEDDNAASEEVTLINTPSGGGYGSVAAKSVVVTTEDDDTPGLVLSRSSLSVGEGSSGTYTVRLATQPSGPVTVTVSGMAKGVSVDDSSLAFSTSNWSDAQTVAVSAAEDDNAASEEVTLTNTPSGGDYGSVAAKSVVVDDGRRRQTGAGVEQVFAAGFRGRLGHVHGEAGDAAERPGDGDGLRHGEGRERGRFLVDVQHVELEQRPDGDGVGGGGRQRRLRGGDADQRAVGRRLRLGRGEDGGGDDGGRRQTGAGVEQVFAAGFRGCLGHVHGEAGDAAERPGDGDSLRHGERRERGRLLVDVQHVELEQRPDGDGIGGGRRQCRLGGGDADQHAVRRRLRLGRGEVGGGDDGGRRQTGPLGDPGEPGVGRRGRWKGLHGEAGDGAGGSGGRLGFSTGW